MQGQINKNTKKAAKRHNRNKRRKKLRQQRKLEAIRNGIPYRKFQVQLPKQQQLPQQQQQQQQQQHIERWEALCLETFQRLTTWQNEAELNFWKARTEYLQNENKLLKQQIESLTKQDEEKDDDMEDVDPAYLEFIAVTHQHREELRRARACISENVTGVD